METANLNGFSQAGAPVMTRWSIAMPANDAPATTIITVPIAVNGALPRHSRANHECTSLLNVVSVNIQGIPLNVDAVNISRIA